MPQTTPFETDVIQFNANGGNTIVVSSDLNGNMTFQDGVVSSAISLVDLAGLESASSVFVVGKKYTTIQDALDAVSVTSSVSNPSVILIPAGIYNESISIEKDGLHIIGLGLVEITGVAGTSSVSIIDTGAAIPLSVKFQNITISKSEDAERALSIVGTDGTNLGLGGLVFENCHIKGTGVGTFALYVNIANKILIEGGSTTGSSATAKFSVAQCSEFIVRDSREIPNVELSYDNTTDKPSTLTSIYSFTRNDLCGDFLVSLLGVGSLSVSSCTIGDLSIDGTQTLNLIECDSENLTVSGTTVATMTEVAYTTLLGDVTATLILDKERGTATFLNETTKTVSLPLTYPNTSYMVLLDSPTLDRPYVSNKTTTSFDIVFSGNTTTDVLYQVLKF